MKKIIHLLLGMFLLIGFVPQLRVSAAEQMPVPLTSTAAYDAGSPALTDVWVDAVHGNDSNNGSSPDSAYQTLTQAWSQIPQNTTLITGFRINLQPGTYTVSMLPNYWEERHGTFNAPIYIRGNGSTRNAVTLQGSINMYDSYYVYFENLSIAFAGDAFHCELCDHVLLRNLRVSGGNQQAQETIKINQSQYVYIENSDISGAWDNTIDFVAVQYGHIVNNNIHNAGDWCAYAKGGSAYLLVEGNRIYDCGTGGFTAGQGTGFQFMTQPWIQYEAYDIKVINNLVYNTEGAGLGVNGGYNILLAYNTLYHVGERSHVLEVVYGMRSCDGQPGDSGRERCQQYLDAGGWGTTVVDDGDNAINIPNKNVFIYNNIVYNPAGYQSQWSHFAIYDPRPNPNSSHIPNVVTDDNLQIKGNIIWNGSASMPLGIEDTQACTDPNPTCNQAQLLADNYINEVQPQFASPAGGDFHPTGTWMASVSPVAIPDFTWDIGGVASGNNDNSVFVDWENLTRSGADLPGALITTITLESMTLYSNAAQDGWVRESTERSSKGGSIKSGGGQFSVGDDALNRQYRGILSFDTSSLPDDAVISSIKIRLRYAGKTGTLPFNTHQGLYVDVRSGVFSTSASLQKADFQAGSASLLAGKFGNSPAGGWYSVTMNNPNVNKQGATQFRVRFKRDDNNDFGADLIRFYSGNAAAASRPQLIIQYYIP